MMQAVRHRWVLAVAVAVVAVVAVIAFLALRPARTWPGDALPDVPALELVETLEVMGRGPMSDFDRALFGEPWADVDGNGCDTRNDVLRRDLTDVTVRSDGCAVTAGTLMDPFSGVGRPFERGPETSPLVQIDHVVALADAWQKGARTWTPDRRTRFANDPLNLLAVDGALNQAKGAGDVATWLPPDRGYWCPYAARVVAVKATYGLAVTAAEGERLTEILGTCPQEPLPSRDDAAR